jgi:hypothetical protein
MTSLKNRMNIQLKLVTFIKINPNPKLFQPIWTSRQ